MGLEIFGTPTVTTTVIGPVNAPASSRGFIVQLGKRVALNLNAVAATTIFTVPASGLTRAVVAEVVLDNFSGTNALAQVSFGASGTPTDWSAAITLTGAAANKAMNFNAPGATAFATYGVGVAFVANVTVVAGAALTCDAEAWGWYE